VLKFQEVAAFFAKATFDQIPHHNDKHLTQHPPAPPHSFLGREEELTEIHELLNQESRLLLVNGIGGIGKTTIAQAYCEQHRDQFRHIAWLTCNPYIAEAVT